MRRLLFACASAALVGLVACEDLVGPGGDAVDLSYAPCAGADDNPVWFAAQDGEGAWRRVNPSASGSFDFSVSSGKAGVAMLTNDGLFVIYATTDELKSNFPSCGGSVRSITGSVVGYTTSDDVNLAVGTSSTVVFGTDSPPAPFTLAAVDATANDLVAVRYRQTSFEAFPNNVVIRRNVSGTSTSTVDFASATEAGAPLNRTLSVSNLEAGEELKVYSYVGLRSTTANIAAYEAAPALSSGQATAPFYGVAGSRLEAGEGQMIYVNAGKTILAANTHGSRFMTFVFTNPSDRSMTLGPALGNVTLTGTARPSASYNVQSGYDNLYDVVYKQGSGTNTRQVEVVATNSYLDGATTVTLTVPDLSDVSGFSSSWLLVPGVAAGWAFLATNADIAILTGKPITYQGADRASTFTP